MHRFPGAEQELHSHLRLSDDTRHRWHKQSHDLDEQFPQYGLPAPSDGAAHLTPSAMHIHCVLGPGDVTFVAMVQASEKGPSTGSLRGARAQSASETSVPSPTSPSETVDWNSHLSSGSPRAVSSLESTHSSPSDSSLSVAGAAGPCPTS